MSPALVGGVTHRFSRLGVLLQNSTDCIDPLDAASQPNSRCSGQSQWATFLKISQIIL